MRDAKGILVATLAFALAGPGWAAEPAAVAVPVPGGAAFSFAPGADPARIAATAEGDGARLVACGAATVAAAGGAKVEVACGADAEIALVSGTFRVAVGSRGALVRVGGKALRASSGRLLVAALRGAWAVRWEPDDEAGAAAWEPAPAPAPAAEATPAPPEPSAIAPGEIAAVGATTGAPSPAELRKAIDAAARLAPKAPAAAALAPRRVESPEDLRADAAAAAGGTSEVELEAIEVEAGCIEVCVD